MEKRELVIFLFILVLVSFVSVGVYAQEEGEENGDYCANPPGTPGDYREWSEYMTDYDEYGVSDTIKCASPWAEINCDEPWKIGYTGESNCWIVDYGTSCPVGYKCEPRGDTCACWPTEICGDSVCVIRI